MGGKVSNEDMLDNLCRVAELLGRTPSHHEYNKYGAFSHETLARRFGSWREACSEVGLEPNIFTHEVVEDPKDLLIDLKRVADELGRTPSMLEYNDLGSYSHNPLVNRFGSWREVCRKVGLEPNEFTQKNVDPRLRDKEWLREQYIEKNLTSREIANECSCTLASVLYRLRSFDIEIREPGAAPVECDELGLRFRSGWEHRVAHRLDELGAGFEYEPGWVETPVGCYLPDFVLDGGAILEVKGRADYGDNALQAEKLEHLMDRGRWVVLIGSEEARDAFPYDAFVPYDGGRCSSLEAIFGDMGLQDD